jgi:hypothetical protein
MKFGMDVMPLVTNENSQSLTSHTQLMSPRDCRKIVRCKSDIGNAHATLRIQPNLT